MTLVNAAAHPRNFENTHYSLEYNNKLA